MNRTPVTSSNIASIGYDPDTQVMEVEFTSKSVYQYLGVPPRIANDTLIAESVGKFFNANVKNAFPFVKAAA
jgi:hypothetical protein